jgi:hypothetical protein
MIKSLSKASKLCAPGPCTVIKSESDQKQSRRSTKGSLNLASWRSCTFASSSNKEKHPSMMKLQGHLVTLIISVATLSMCTTSTLMVAGLRRIGKRILDPLRKKEAREPSSKGQTSIIREGACQAEAVVTAEAHTHSSFHTACIITAKPTTTQKTAPYSSSLKER